MADLEHCVLFGWTTARCAISGGGWWCVVVVVDGGQLCCVVVVTGLELNSVSSPVRTPRHRRRPHHVQCPPLARRLRPVLCLYLVVPQIQVFKGSFVLVRVYGLNVGKKSSYGFGGFIKTPRR